MTISIAVCAILAILDGSPIAFKDVAAEAGVAFRFENGSRGKHDLPEIMGGGVALFDFDGDHKLDIYLCNGGPIAPDPDPGRSDPPSRLYRNLGGMKFEDVTERAGAPGPSRAFGAAVGDYDGDGRDDLFVTGLGDRRLYRNKGGGSFEDVTDRVGLAASPLLWDASAAFADLDGDGDLDLYVTSYLEYVPATAPYCAAPDGKRDYCGPEDFPSQDDRLYRNDGGKFVDVSKSAGIALAGRGLGVLIADLVGDARPDVYVANDGSACRLFENLGGLRFRDVAATSGVAFDAAGNALAGMGVALGDLDGDGRSDLVVTNFLERSTIAYRSLGEGRFLESSARFGLSRITRSVLGFGVVLEDFDGDGALDLFQANGHVLDRERLGVPFAMRPSLLRNVGGRFEDASESAGSWFRRPILGRGAAVGDLDDDGKPDLVVNSIDAPAAVLHNRTPNARFASIDARRYPAGTRLKIFVGDRVEFRDVSAGGSYLSASERRIFIALRPGEDFKRVEPFRVNPSP